MIRQMLTWWFIFFPHHTTFSHLLSLSHFLSSFCYKSNTHKPFSPPAGLRKHDVCFLITVRPMLLYGTRFDRRQSFVDQTGLVYVRGCEVQGMLDDKGRVIEEGMLICVCACVRRLTHTAVTPDIHPPIRSVHRQP